MSLSKRTLRELRDYFRSDGYVTDSWQRRVYEELNRELTPRRSVTKARKAARAKKQTRSQEWREMRERVFRRAGGICEACKVMKSCMLQADHMLGGSGRRRALESYESVWVLCGDCHRRKTLNQPSASYWLAAFLAHSATYGFNGPAQEQVAARLDALTLKAQQAHTPGRTT